MIESLNSIQAKLLANFCSDLSKGLILAGISVPFASRELWIFKILVSTVSFVIA